MNVTTQEGLMTDLRWWSQLRVEGDAIVLSDVRTVGENTESGTAGDEVEELNVLTVFEGDQETVQDLFKAINLSIQYSQEHFAVDAWLEERSA